MDPQQQNNGFGPISKPRGRTSVITASFLIVLSGAGQYKIWTADCGLRTTDCGLGIKHGLGIKRGLRTEYKTRTRYKTRTTDYVYKNSFRKVNLREKKSGLA